MEGDAVLMDWKQIVKIQILPKSIDSAEALSKYLQFFVKIHKLVVNFIWKNKGTTIAKTVLKKDKVVEIILPGVKGHYRDRVNSTFGTGKRLDTEVDRIESCPAIDSYICSQLIFNNSIKAIQ